MTVSRALRAAAKALTELLQIGREMIVIPLQIWLLVAEVAGGLVLEIWLRALLPVLRAGRRLLEFAYALTAEWLTPARGVAIVAAAAALALAGSQWADYRGVSVGTDAYGAVQTVAPAPDVDRERAGDAHAWLMLPLAAAALACAVLAVTRRPRLGRALAPIGIAALAIALLVDLPNGLDEGAAAVAYQSAEAHLLGGFWAQVASAGVITACGLLLPGYARRRAPSRRREPAGAVGRDPDAAIDQWRRAERPSRLDEVRTEGAR